MRVIIYKVDLVKNKKERKKTVSLNSFVNKK